jgi:hypothetical protein
MRTCRHCGTENADTGTLCTECGLELGDSPLRQTSSQLVGRFFCWRPASIILIFLAVLYGAVALLNVWKGRDYAARGHLELSHFMYWGTFWNLVIAALCLTGRQVMSRRTSARLLAGAFPIAVALAISMRSWVGGLLTGRNPVPLFDIVVAWLPLLYVIIYAYRTSRTKADT